MEGINEAPMFNEDELIDDIDGMDGIDFENNEMEEMDLDMDFD